MTTESRDAQSIRSAISNAYYETREAGGTMEAAADAATAAVLDILDSRAALDAARSSPEPSLREMEQAYRDTIARLVGENRRLRAFLDKVKMALVVGFIIIYAPFMVWASLQP